MLQDIEEKVTIMMSHKEFVDVGLGLRRYAPWLDFSRLFSYTLCNTDSTSPFMVDFQTPRITLCANFLAKEEDLAREVTTSLVVLHDYLRNKGPWKSCAEFGCTMTRAAILSNRCPQVATRGTCLMTHIQGAMSHFPLCQNKHIPYEAEDAFQQCHMDRSPFGLL